MYLPVSGDAVNFEMVARTPPAWNDVSWEWVLASAIASLEAFGTAEVQRRIEPTGIASAETFGTAQVDQRLRATGLASAEAFGTAAVLSASILQPSGISSAEGFGEPQVVLRLEPAGIPSAEVFGTPLILAQTILYPDGIATAEAFGSAKVLSAGQLYPDGIPSGEGFGTAKLHLRLMAISIASEEGFGEVLVDFILVPEANQSRANTGVARILTAQSEVSKRLRSTVAV